ncbi:protein kinase [Sorangium sp. So ce216]
MALSRGRVLAQGTTPHRHEQEALEFVKSVLPDTDPYRIWALVDLVDSSGRRYELDLVVLGYHALYLVEIESHPGTVSGDVVDWRFRSPEGHVSIKENPLRLTAHKARILGSLLEKQMGKKRPHVEQLVFLSDPNIQVTLEGNAKARVVTRRGFLAAMQHGDYPGSETRPLGPPIDRPMGQAIDVALKALGLRESKGAMKVGELALGELIEEGPGYQDREAQHERMATLKRRVRSYLVPQSPGQERRDQLRRAADREAEVLSVLSDHPAILRFTDYIAEGPMGGPCIVFEDFAGGLPLDVYLRRHPDLSFAHRIHLVQQLADALDYCHRKKVLHRGLHPGAVLVRDRQDNNKPPEVRLYNFQLASREDGSSGTVHLSALAPDRAVVYRAPEVIEEPSAAKPESDVFSLGAIAYQIFTRTAPGATLLEREMLLQAGGGRLSIAAVRDDLAGGATPLGETERKSLDDVVGFATEANPVQRADNALEWLDLLLQAVTAPATGPVPGLDPLEARPGDLLGGKLSVARLLGTGATARVLAVERDGSLLALKVPLAPEFEDRLRAEAEVLGALRSERIVRLEGTPTLGGRFCLLTSYGGETLADLLTREGPPSLDYARRWGEDLLRALEFLEDEGVQHRDIKPANVGVLPSQSKKQRHLYLFDFSLSMLDSAQTLVGTPAYRDPFVPLRGRWDEAADRFSAAVTLYELLTGTRPRWGRGDVPATAGQEEMSLDAERFDTAVRGRLVPFFRRAFAREAGQRHETAEQMRTEWIACFAAAPGEASADEAEGAPPVAADLSMFTEATPVEALPLGAREKNALDRSGIVTVRELLALPQNQLSAIRGVGRETARAIQDFVERWRAARATAGVASSVPEGGAPGRPRSSPPLPAPFYPGFQGEDAAVAYLPGVPRELTTALADAGLARASHVAAASPGRILHVLGDRPDAAEAVRAALAKLAEGAADDVPATLAAWLDLLLPDKAAGAGKATNAGKAAGSGRARVAAGRGPASAVPFKHVRELFGLDPVEGERITEASLLAKKHRISPQAVYLQLSKAREHWRGFPRLQVLHDLVHGALASLGGVASVASVGAALASAVPAGPAAADASPDAAARLAEALVRVVVETSEQLVIGPVRGLWIAPSYEHLRVARALGDEADALAAREPLPASEEARAALAARVKDTELAALPPERLVSLAAEASRTAAKSARLELYPRAMSPARALKLSAGAMAHLELQPDEIVKAVVARYPEAERPPPRPALDALVLPLGLEWSDEKSAYIRPGALPTSTVQTELPPPRLPTHHGSRRPTRDPLVQEAREFDERLRLAASRKLFRVIEVNCAFADDAASWLSRDLGIEPVSLDRAILRAAEAVAREWEIPDRDVLDDADRAGPTGPDWANLRDLMRESAERVVRDLVAKNASVLLTQPGLLARYRLDGVLATLIEATQKDDGPAVFLLVPAYDDLGPAPIDAVPTPMPIPQSSPAQRLRLPESWIRNRHRAMP